MQAQVQRDVVKAAEKKRAERREDELMKAKVVAKGRGSSKGESEL